MNKKQLIEKITETNNYLIIVEELVTDLIENIDELQLEEMYKIRSYICKIILNNTNEINKTIQNDIRNHETLKYDMKYIQEAFETNINNYGYILLSELNYKRLEKVKKDIKKLKKGYDY